MSETEAYLAGWPANVRRLTVVEAYVGAIANDALGEGVRIVVGSKDETRCECGEDGGPARDEVELESDESDDDESECDEAGDGVSDTSGDSARRVVRPR